MFREAAEQARVRISLATDRCDHLDDPWGDDAIPVRWEDPAGSAEALMEALAVRGPATGVAALGDRTTFLASLFAERAGLPFHPPHATEAANNKFLSKERFRAAGLPQPGYRRYAIATIPEAPFLPCVLKPLGLSGSRGVIRADTPEEFAAAFERIRCLLQDRDILRRADDQDRWIQVESFIPGSEYAVEGLATDGRLQVLALFDKPDPLDGPYFEETLYVTPSRAPGPVQREITETVQRGITALGFTSGPVHAEVRHNETGVYILEIAARPIGGYCARALRFDNGMTLEELVLRHALGEDVSRRRLRPGGTGLMMLPIPKAGVYKGVTGVAEAAAVPGIEEVRIAAVDGQLLKTYPEAGSYLGFLFAHAANAAAAEAALRRAQGLLRFDIATELLAR